MNKVLERENTAPEYHQYHKQHKCHQPLLILRGLGRTFRTQKAHSLDQTCMNLLRYRSEQKKIKVYVIYILLEEPSRDIGRRA